MKLITYLDSCLKKGKICRWPTSCMPIKVYIAPFKWYKAKDESYYYRQMVLEALRV